MIIKNKHAHFANAKMILHTVGKVQLKDGTVEVPDEVGKDMIKHHDWSDVNAEPIKEAAKEPKIENSPVSAQNLMTSKEKETLIGLVKEMNHEELLKTAAESNIKGSNLFKAPEKIETLRNLIIKNIQKIA